MENKSQKLETPRIGIPDDVNFTHILPRLPVKSIVRFTSVCKTWKSLIFSPKFMKSHFLYSSSNCRQYLYRNGHDKYWYSVPYDGSTLKPAVKLDDRNVFFRRRFEVSGCCNGLICLLSSSSRFALWNPATNELRKISKAFNTYQSTPYLHGFRYVPGLNDYIIFAGLLLEHQEIFSLKTGIWSEIKDNINLPVTGTGFKCRYPAGVGLGDTLYWYVSYKDGHQFKNSIIGFNLLTREFETIPISKWVRKYISAKLLVVQGCLSLACYRLLDPPCDGEGDAADVWILKQEGDSNSRVKAFSVRVGIRLMDVSIPGLYTILYDEELHLIDITTDEMVGYEGAKTIGFPFHITYYFPTLISPFQMQELDIEDNS